MSDDPFRDAFDAAMAHLERCDDTLIAEEENGEIESASSAPYCGCTTCQVREALVAAWPHLRDAALAGREVCEL